MKRLIVFVFITTITITLYAQDVIVKRDGTTILSKVVEINKNEIKYKKFSKKNGPLYVIEKAEVMSINYESGDKEIFTDDIKSASTGTAPLEINPNLEEDNLRLVREYNNRKIEYIGQKPNSSCGGYGIVLKMEEGSIIETPELRLDYNTKSGWTMDVILYNKTNKRLYVDLASCFYIECDNAQALYVPSSTSSGESSTSGGSVNLGSIAGAIGIGGALGTLASGITVGGANTNTNTTTVYSQRIVTIPPMASISINKIPFHTVTNLGAWFRDRIHSKILSKYLPYFVSRGILKENSDDCTIRRGKLKRGQIIDIPRIPGNELSVHITYSTDEKLTNTQSIRTNFYVGQIVGMPSLLEGSSKIVIPLLYMSSLDTGCKIWKD